MGHSTVREPLFDPASVPSDVRSPDRVTEVNTLIARLRSYLVDRVEMQEADTGFRVSMMARVYNQAHLRRSLQLIEAARDLVYARPGLAALTLVRGLYETVANYVAVNDRRSPQAGSCPDRWKYLDASSETHSHSIQRRRQIDG
jgi:hypothetical protein